MSRKCCSGPVLDWLFVFLLLLRVHSREIDNTHVQDDTMVCNGRQALFRWNYDVKPFFGVLLTHNRSKITSLTSLTLTPEVIISDQFKGRLNFTSQKPFSFTLDNATSEDSGMYECSFAFDKGNTDTLAGHLIVKDLLHNDSLVKEVEQNDSCVTLSWIADPPCKWTFPNGRTEVAKEIRYCSTEAKETIRCESDHVCKFAEYTKIFSGESKDTTNSTGLIAGGLFAGLVPVVVIVIIVTLYLRKRRKEHQRKRLPQQINEDADEDEKEKEEL